MKHLSIAVLIFTALALPSCAGPSEEVKASPSPSVAATPVENVEEIVTQLEKDWVAAIVKKDLAALDGLLAADFNGTSPTGSTFPKSEAIGDLKNGAYTVESMVMDEVSVNVYGSSAVAVAFTSQQEKSKVNGKDNSGHYHFTNVWVKRDGKWQVVASHGSRLVNAK